MHRNIHHSVNQHTITFLKHPIPGTPVNLCEIYMEVTFVYIIRTMCNDNEMCELNCSWHQNLISAYSNELLCELCMPQEFFKVIYRLCDSNKIFCEMNYSWQQALIFLWYGITIVWATYVVRTSPHYSYIVQQEFFHAIPTYYNSNEILCEWHWCWDETLHFLCPEQAAVYSTQVLHISSNHTLWRVAKSSWESDNGLSLGAML